MRRILKNFQEVETKFNQKILLLFKKEHNYHMDIRINLKYILQIVSTEGIIAIFRSRIAIQWI